VYESKAVFSLLILLVFATHTVVVACYAAPYNAIVRHSKVAKWSPCADGVHRVLLYWESTTRSRAHKLRHVVFVRPAERSPRRQLRSQLLH
jgi:hypothetical protein